RSGRRVAGLGRRGRAARERDRARASRRLRPRHRGTRRATAQARGQAALRRTDRPRPNLFLARAGHLGEEEPHVATRSLLATAAAMDGSIDEAIAMNEDALGRWPAGVGL